MKMKKIILLVALLAALMAVPSAFALLVPTNVTFNVPSSNFYSSSSGSLKLNITNSWTGNTNLTNVTFVFKLVTNDTRYTNSTVNGTKTSITTGDFTYTISLGDLAEGSYSVLAELHNDTDVSNTATAANSSAITVVIDRTNPTVTISSPYTGSTVIPTGAGMVTFDYIPSNSNLANCSLHLNNQLVKTSASGTVNSNITSGSVNRFSAQFNNDNSSIQLAINCIDLAGLRTSSSTFNNFTFNVLTTGFSPAQKQAIASAAGGGGYSSAHQSSGFTAAQFQNNVNTVKTSFQQYAWIYAIAGIIAFAFIIKKIKK